MRPLDASVLRVGTRNNLSNLAHARVHRPLRWLDRIEAHAKLLDNRADVLLPHLLDLSIREGNLVVLIEWTPSLQGISDPMERAGHAPW